MSAQAVSGSLTCTLALTNQLTGTSGTAKTQLTAGASPIVIAAGTGAGQCNELWSQQIDFVASTPQTLDLTALVGEGGRAVDFAAVKVLMIQVITGFPVTVGNAATNAWSAPFNAATDTVTVPASTGALSQGGATVGTPLLLVNLSAAGWTVDSIHKSLKLDPGANALSIILSIAGLSA